MRRFGQVARLKPEKIEEYKVLHAVVWPEVLKTIHRCNLRNYTIHLLDGQVFARFDYVGDDYEADMALMAADPATQRWWTHTKPCFENHAIQEYYRDMEEIFFTE